VLRTGKIIKIRVFEREENLLQNGILQVRIYTDEKLTCLKGTWHLNG